MKKLIFLFSILSFFSSCATTKEARLSRIEARKEKNLAEQASVKDAVESKRYIIKFDKIYFTRGGIADLIPRANYLIIDGDRAIINTAYLGRQIDVLPIIAINIKGISTNYSISKDSSKGLYKIQMDVGSKESGLFDIYLTIGENGYCSLSLSSIRIDYITYRGRLVPIKPAKVNNNPRGIAI